VDNLLLKDRKRKTSCEQPTHKTAHLQIAQANARPKFAKELFIPTAPKKKATVRHGLADLKFNFDPK
jgi:hypothetical protein